MPLLLQQLLLYQMVMVLLGQFLKTDGSGNLDFATVNQFIDLAGDSGTDTYNTAETLTFSGSGMSTAITDNEVTINVQH